MPEEGYQGEYVTHLADEYDGPEDVVEAGRFASEAILGNIRATLDRLDIRFDEWYSQASIEESGQVAETIELFRERGLVYEADGAIWLRSTEVGDSRDRVLIRTNGDVTYLAGDLAYHRDKFLVRRFDRVIDIFGADHHGQVASLKAGVAALGIEHDRLEIRLGQLVNIVGRRMSKRSGVYIKLDEVIDEMGPDATRLLSLLNSIDQATTLDLDLMKRRSMENPVFYVQYAHARIASIDRKRAERGIERVPLPEADLELLVHDRELELIRCLVDLPRVVAEAAKERAPHKVTNWVRLLAGEFHGFYHDCRVLSEEVPPELTQARLWLVEGVQIGLAIALGLLGVRAARGDVTGAESPSGVPVPEGPILWDLLPDTSAVTGDGHLSVGGVDLMQLADEVGTPRVRLRRGPPARAVPTGFCRLRGWRRLRDQGVLVQGDGRGWPSRRSWRSTSRPVGRWPLPWREARAVTSSSATATTSPWTSSLPPCGPASAGLSSTRSTRSSGWAPSAPRRPPPGVAHVCCFA